MSEQVRIVYVDMEPRAKELSEFLGIPYEEVEGTVCYAEYEAHGCEYLVLTEEEAEERAREYIRESLWAFNAEFLVGHMKVELDAEDIRVIQEKRCESCNEMMLALVGDNLEDLMDDAIASDGRGHFINTYDFEENESGDYFIYRTN